MTSVSTAVRILIVEDEPGVRNLISLALKHQGYSADVAEDIAEASVRLRQAGSRYAAVLVDLSLPGNTAGLIEESRHTHPGVPIIGLCDDVSTPVRVAMDEMIEKPITVDRLRAVIQKHLRDPRKDSVPLDEAVAKGGFGARSGVWQSEVQPLIRHVSAADIPVLIQGETGVGKEVLARQLHNQSPRGKKVFLKVNCAALPSELIESELFGYERGAFTGAFKNTPGKFEMAEGGSILLDEIGDMDFKLQAKLLQVLQDREFVRLGSSEARRVDVRVFAATHCNLEHAIAERRFREDLYYRLNIITIHVPALRERKDEILPLAYHFLHKHSTPATPAVEFTPYLREVLLSHDWPGNVRELENVIRRLLVLRHPEMIADDILTRARRRDAVHAPAAPAASNEPLFNLPKPAPVESMAAAAAAGVSQMHASQPVGYWSGGNMQEDVSARTKEGRGLSGVPPTRPYRIDEGDRWSILDRVDEARREAETEAILQALNSTLWNRKRAAELLSIDYKALLYKMKKLGIVDRAAKIAI